MLTLCISASSAIANAAQASRPSRASATVERAIVAQSGAGGLELQVKEESSSGQQSDLEESTAVYKGSAQPAESFLTTDFLGRGPTEK
jgi:hypothetical protein